MQRQYYCPPPVTHSYLVSGKRRSSDIFHVADLIIAAEQRADALQQAQMLSSLLASLFCCLFVLAMHWVSVLASVFCCLIVLALHWVSVHMQLAGQQTSRCQSPLEPIRETMASKNTLAGEGK